ncbi:MAG: membrane protein insertase YidC [Acidimicrobiales bacterium]|nr:membrane protein insertase YidC [Acidimicrobiales bacterium]
MSSITQILKPFYYLIGWILASLYKIVPNYALSIVLLTFIVLIPFTPLIARSVKASARMQALQPELKRINELYKGDSAKRSEETMAVFKREGVSPAGGCLPILPQMVVLLVFYSVLRGLTNTTGGKHPLPNPLYIPKTSTLFENIYAAKGHLVSFGMDLSQKITAHHGSIASSIPYWAILIIGGGLQYFQVQRMTSRMPKNNQMNAQTQFVMQKIMPLAFLWFYLILPAGVCLYYLTSTVVRIFQYEWVYYRHPGIAQGVFDVAPKKLFNIRPAQEPSNSKELPSTSVYAQDDSADQNPKEDKKKPEKKEEEQIKKTPPHPRSKQKKQRKER